MIKNPAHALSSMVCVCVGPEISTLIDAVVSLDFRESVVYKEAVCRSGEVHVSRIRRSNDWLREVHRLHHAQAQSLDTMQRYVAIRRRKKLTHLMPIEVFAHPYDV